MFIPKHVLSLVSIILARDWRECLISRELSGTMDYTYTLFPLLDYQPGYQPEHDGHSTAGHDGHQVAGPEVDQDHAGEAHLARLGENVEAEGECEHHVQS